MATIYLPRRCNEPPEHHGETLSKVLENDGFQCPYAHSYVKRGMYGPLVLSTIVVGIILLVTGSALFAYALYRRTRVSLLSLAALLRSLLYYYYL